MKFLIIFITTLVFANIGNITDIKGNVIITRNHKNVKATINMPIYKKDTIFTFNNSKVKIIFNDKTIINIGKNSILKIKNYFYKNKIKFNLINSKRFLIKKEPKAEFNFLEGSFIIKAGKIAKLTPKNFKIEITYIPIVLKNAIIAFGEITKKREIIGCGQGSIKILYNNKHILLKKGEMINILKNIAPSKISALYLKKLINSLSLNKKEIKTFFKKIYNKNKKNELSWNEYKKIEEKNINNIVPNFNFKTKEDNDKLFFANLENLKSNNVDTTNNDSDSTNNDSDSTNNDSDTTNNDSDTTNNDSDTTNNDSDTTNNDSDTTNNDSDTTNNDSDTTNNNNNNNNNNPR